MPSFGRLLSGIIMLTGLCNGVKWVGPTQTANHSRPDTIVAKDTPSTTMAAISRRATSALSLCGYESGQRQQPVTCNGGYSCEFSTLPFGGIAALVYGCCHLVEGCSTFYTTCLDSHGPSSTSANVLVCTDDVPFCESYTFPEVNAVAFGCIVTSDSMWHTVLLDYTTLTNTLTKNSSSTSSIILTGAPSSRATLPPTSTCDTGSNCGNGNGNGNTVTPSAITSSGDGIQDLTLDQKIGIGMGSGVAFILVSIGIGLRCRMRRLKTPAVLIDEKQPPIQVAEVKKKEPVLEVSTMG